MSSGVQKPITGSTPARLYQLRSKITDLAGRPGSAGRTAATYICDFSRSVGVGRATTRNTRGLTRSVIRLIVPPFPAVSRPSNTTQILAPDSFTHSCMATSSPCRTLICRSYSFRFIFGRGTASACSLATGDGWAAASCRPCVLFFLLFFAAISLPPVNRLARMRAHLLGAAAGTSSPRASALGRPGDHVAPRRAARPGRSRR